MCGFPLSHLDRYLKALVHQNQRFVAMCEEFKRLDGTFERRVVRIVTPGTLIDESFLNHHENNYLVSISMGEEAGTSEVGLAWTDVSTGEVFSQPTSIENLRDDLMRIGPREVILDSSLKDSRNHPFFAALGEDGDRSITYVNRDVHPTPTIIDNALDTVEDPQDISAPPIYTPVETSAFQLLSTFLRTHLLELMPHLPAPTRQSVDLRMQIDSHTIRALEIKEGMREGGATGSLLSTVKRTLTSGGTRLLARWLCA